MLVGFASGTVVLLLDQWSKWMVRGHLAHRSISCGPILQIKCISNVQESYRHKRARAVLALVWLTALVSAAILHSTGAWFQSQLAVLGLGLAFGGAAGNLVDILWRRHVVDFIDLGWWPVFNLADIGIVLGLLAAFLY